MDPEGKFVEAFGQIVGADEMTEKVAKAVAEYDGRK